MSSRERILESAKKKRFAELDDWFYKQKAGDMEVEWEGKKYLVPASDEAAYQIGTLSILASMDGSLFIPVIEINGETQLPSKRFLDYAHAYMCTWAGLIDWYGNLRSKIREAKTIGEVKAIKFDSPE